MAKELPYFKFEPAEYDTGNIQLCSFEEQGIFINICSMYWQRLGDLPYKLALQKVCGGNATALNSLSEVGVIRIIDGSICIDFLNEQLAEFDTASKKNSENARSGWEKRRKNAVALRTESDRNAIREEKRREEDIDTADFFKSNAHAYMSISGNYHDMDGARKIISNIGWPGVQDHDIKAIIHHFIETQADVQKPAQDVRSHFRRWVNKQKPESLQTLCKTIHDNHARRAQRQGQGPTA